LHFNHLAHPVPPAALQASHPLVQHRARLIGSAECKGRGAMSWHKSTPVPPVLATTKIACSPAGQTQKQGRPGLQRPGLQRPGKQRKRASVYIHKSERKLPSGSLLKPDKWMNSFPFGNTIRRAGFTPPFAGLSHVTAG
jgi:hypothetical protein